MNHGADLKVTLLNDNGEVVTLHSDWYWPFSVEIGRLFCV